MVLMLPNKQTAPELLSKPIATGNSSYQKAMLKLIVNFATILIGAEGARLLENASHFLRAVFVQGCPFNVLRE
ncbi:hypothetical protein CVD28_17990 [Bacillus sp. M6-12]|uniref:hypothetical protein n=1 Tax=Bacillus sp. M6-12 TaxID=2054166 RepID=UPI000C7772FC|nr:hypothetical protein [Bacillus sp. M6-12]PLS16357.1 hypothetical protein CVD28_17990 [Bacillus sp. M6-12]